MWRVPNPTTANAALVTKIQQGRATLADLAAGGATQRGVARDDYAPCADNGEGCTDDLYAVSLPSVFPAAFLTWFQAQEACANSGKQLPTNAEWQVGANGTPDPGANGGAADCNTTRGAPTLTGARASCRSARGASDMVGNVAEWVADWVPLSSTCPGWDGLSDDYMCLAGATTTESGPARSCAAADSPAERTADRSRARHDRPDPLREFRRLPLRARAARARQLRAARLGCDRPRGARASSPNSKAGGVMLRTITIVAALALAASPAGAQLGTPSCPPDSVPAGSVCMDKFEASVWRIPNPTTTNAALVRKIQGGTVTRAELVAAGARQLSRTDDDYAPCRDDGQNCVNDIFAVSLPSVMPSAFATWFQAQEACANSGKRLPTSAEWQIAANGTPDAGPDNGTTDCTTDGPQVSLTGARTSCRSNRGAFDMVGNLAEWTADWTPHTTGCLQWAAEFSNDIMCLAGASETSGPGALLRGGFYFFMGDLAGPHAVTMDEPSGGFHFIGFRCAR